MKRTYDIGKPYLEIFRNLDKEGMCYNCYLDDILERQVKCVTT